jgi:hypothetical protein
MEAIMTVTDLVRDRCKAAARMVQCGERITVKSGNKVLFRIVPSDDLETKMTVRQYQAFVKDLNSMACKADLDSNPVVKLRQL